MSLLFRGGIPRRELWFGFRPVKSDLLFESSCSPSGLSLRFEGADEEFDPVRGRLGFCLRLNGVSTMATNERKLPTHSSDSSRVRFPSVPTSLLSSIDLRTASASSNVLRLFIVARRLVLSRMAFLFSFFRDCSAFEFEGEDRWDEGSRTGR